jgi:hypothetical protein
MCGVSIHIPLTLSLLGETHSCHVAPSSTLCSAAVMSQIQGYDGPQGPA